MQVRIILALTVLVTGVVYFTQNKNEKLMAAPPVGYTDFVTTPNVNVINPNVTSTAEVSGDYSLKFRISDKVTYEPFGESQNVPFTNTTPGHVITAKSRVFKFNPADNNAHPERGVWIYNAAVYKGKDVDVKLVLDKLDFAWQVNRYPSANFFALDPSERSLNNDNLLWPNSNGTGKIVWEKAFMMMGGNSYSALLGTTGNDYLIQSSMSDWYTSGDSYFYHYEFYDAETKKPLVVKGIWNYNNINDAKKVTTEFDGDFSRIFVANDATENLGYKSDLVQGGSIEVFGSKSGLAETSRRVDKTFQGENYSTQFTKSRGTFAYNPMIMMYETESLARIAPVKPIVIGEVTSDKHTEPNYLSLNYSIIQDVSDNRAINRNTQLVVESTVPAYYDIDRSSIKVSSYGNANDLTDLFEINVNGSKLTLEAKDPTTDEFNGTIFEIKVSAKPNSSFNFDKVTYNYQNGGKDDGYMLIEQGLSTKVHYKVKDIHDKNIDSEVTEESMAKVLYEGVPDGDPKKDLTFPKGTDFSTIDVQTAYLENLRVDTTNPIDEPVTVSYKGQQPDSSILGEQKLLLVLTTSKGVQVEKEVTLTITDINTTLTVEFIGELANEIHTPVTLDGNTMDLVDLTTNSEVQAVLSDLLVQGYTKLAWDNPSPEHATPYNTGKVTYKFQGNLVLDSVPATLDFGKLTYDANTKRVENPNFKEQFVVSDTRANRAQGWHIVAALTSPMKNSKGQELVNALRYVDDGKETILDANTRMVYKDTEGKNGKVVVSDTWGTTQNTNGIKLQVDASNTVYTGEYTGVITWTIMAGQP